MVIDTTQITKPINKSKMTNPQIANPKTTQISNIKGLVISDL
jgi:hypothetical protein